MDAALSTAPPGAPHVPPAATWPLPQPADRRKLDTRRVGARLIDALVTAAPLIVMLLGVGRGLAIFLVSFMLAYFFLCEALWGQTLGKRAMGLRVLMRDGRPATASAVSARTLLRLIDDNPLGLLVMLLSGRRRQRLGDLIAGTIVARATPGLALAPLSPLILVYPVAWAIGAIALVVVPRPGDGYRTAVDAVCASRNAALLATPPEQRRLRVQAAWALQDRAVIADLPAPKEMQAVRTEILALDDGLNRALGAAIARASVQPDPDAAFQSELPALLERDHARRARYAKLGMPDCAGRTG
jgi:uncharacterized RDD family membrane protein YckC